MPLLDKNPDGSMSFLEHLDELRSRLFRSVLVFAIVFGLCWAYSKPIVAFLLDPVRRHLFDGGDIIFITLTEPFLVYMKAAGLAAVFVVSPYLLYQVWAFVAPGLYRRERIWAAAFILFGTTFFVLGGAFGYWVALPLTAQWLIQLGGDFKAALTLDAAFSFEYKVILGLGLVFQMPVLILILARVGIVTPGFLMRHFRFAVLAIAITAAVITPTGDALTLAVFTVPMILLYLLGVAVAWIFSRPREPRADA